jgi:hypothetical protein
METSGQLHALAALPQGKDPSSGRGGEEITSLQLLGIEPLSSSP